jgi:hypothetical protein
VSGGRARRLDGRPAYEAVGYADGLVAGDLEALDWLTRHRMPPKRGPGRPAWTAATFSAAWVEAVNASTAPHRFGDIAATFRLRDGTRGTSPDYLHRLKSRHGRGIPEAE